MRAVAPAVLLNLWGFTGTMSDRDPVADPLRACFATGHDIAIPPNLDWNINKHDKLARFSPVIDPELARPRQRTVYFSGSSGRRQVRTPTRTAGPPARTGCVTMEVRLAVKNCGPYNLGTLRKSGMLRCLVPEALVARRS